MKYKLKYKDNISVSPYNTEIEKSILLYLAMTETPNIEDVLDIVKDCVFTDLSILTSNEIKAILYKLRSISIGEEIPIKFKCSKCKMVNDTNLNISDIIHGKCSSEINDVFVDLNDDTLQEFVDIDVDELNLEEYDELYDFVKEKMVKFNFKQTILCLKCNEPKHFDISDDKYIIDNMSEDSLMSLYQTTADLVYHGKYTKADVDNMVPFERSIFVGILNKTIESLNT